MSINNLNAEKYLFWTRKIKKPDWNPVPLAIKLSKAFLYPIVFISFLVAFYKTLIGEFAWYILAIFSINLVAVLIFFPIRAKLKNLFLANIDIAVIFSTLIVQIVLIGRYSDFLVLMQIPHLIWVSIVAVLQFSITYMDV